MAKNTSPQPLLNVLMLLAPSGQLSGDGQLRELIAERRDRLGADVPLWYLPAEPTVITWLQLRFGGSRHELQLTTGQLSLTELRRWGAELPPPAPPASLSL